MNQSIPLVVLLLLTLPLIPSVAADHKPSHAEVQNQPPQVTHVDAPTTVTPVAGGERTVNVDIEVFEPNGWEDIQRVALTVYRPDNETVHRQIDATPDGPGTGPRRDYSASFPMAFHDAPADLTNGYVIEVRVTDHPGARSEPAYHKFGYEELTALALDAENLQFGEAKPGGQSDPVPVQVRNVGNVPLGVEVAGMPLVSPDGHEIAESNVHVDTEANVENGVPLKQESEGLDGFRLEPGPDATGDTWWVLHVPSGDSGYIPAGEYAGSILIEAVQAE